ncbi:DNA-binding transcription repressor [Clavispora lusitaniae]|nr:DNA-binding transcription repressor [Clavispora lusitaniae]
MSVAQPVMYGDQLNSFTRGSHHRDSSFNDLLSSFKARVSAQNFSSRSSSSTPNNSASAYVKKRSYSDQASDTHHSQQPELHKAKRSRTAPPSPPTFSGHSPLSNWSDAKPCQQAHLKITLPSLSDALKASSAKPLRPIIPTVSLDYFDTYKPNDENWRYGLLDTIKHTRPSFNLDKYSYLNKHVSPQIPSFDELSKGSRPHFDARVSPKALPESRERKINFPYESNYTYLNKTYMTDVERYSEYLELAHSLVKLSKPQHSTPEQKYSALHPLDTFPLDKVRPLSELGLTHSQQSAPLQYHNHNQRVINHMMHTERTTQDRSTQRTYERPQEGIQERNTHAPEPTQGHKSPQSQSSPIQYSHMDVSKSPLGSSPYSYITPESSFEKTSKEKKVQRTRFIPITPPSVKNKSRSDLMKSPPKSAPAVPRVCISCGSDQSPCWRPSWSSKEGQLCNSCGLRYKKTGARCLNNECKKIPAKGEWSVMQSKGRIQFGDDTAYACLDCGSKVEVNK